MKPDRDYSKDLSKNISGTPAPDSSGFFTPEKRCNSLLRRDDTGQIKYLRGIVRGSLLCAESESCHPSKLMVASLKKHKEASHG